ncbi:LapA family protein [Anaerotignum sp.]|uniref:LapA family protein n=1 Tax=Anaerotignum sp. TaxID=2039241 RepID=UPI002714BF55|nr:LapA family protein [Anaerotignum sp.]
MQKNMIITLLLSIIIALFAILNAEAIPINLVFAKLNVSAALVILISASIGAIIVYLLDAISKFKARKKLKDYEKLNAALTDENSQLSEQVKKYELEIKELKTAAHVYKEAQVNVQE